MFPGRRGVGQAAGASVAFSGFRGAALNQSRSASGVYTGLLCWHECGNQESASCDRGNAAAGVRQKMKFRGYDASSLTQSLPLLPFGCGGRYLHTEKSGKDRHDKRAEKRMRRCRFSIGPPLTSITKSDAQISGGETRQDLKIPGVSPWYPSCALLFLPFGLPVSFRCYGRVCLIPRLTLSSG
jgi:hypothetical protein